MNKNARPLGYVVLYLICFCANLLGQQQKTDDCETVKAILAGASAIHQGMSRAEFEKVFEPASFTFRTSATYVSRKCAFVAVDVEFDTSGSPEGLKPNDRIAKISRAYLALPSKD